MRRMGLSAATAVAILCAAAASAHAQQQYGQPPNTYVTWGNNSPGTSIVDVTYFVGSGTLSATQQNLIRQAAAIWNSAGAGINLVEVGVSGSADVVFSIASTGSTAVVGFTNGTPPPTTPGAGTFPNGSPWLQFNGQVSVSASNLFSGAYGDGTGGTINFLMVALQMVGYGIGLGPAALGDSNSVMTQNIPIGPGLTAPTPNDLMAVQAVYGAPEPATFALFGVGLAALGFSRKFRRS